MNKIRFYDDQLAKTSVFNDWIILAGQDAHKAYYRWNNAMSRSEAGKGERWALIRDSFKLGNDVIPCLLDSKELSQLDRLDSLKYSKWGHSPLWRKIKMIFAPEY